MKTWHLPILGLVCLTLAGCRSTDPAIPALERENRYLEDRIYELYYQLKDAENALEKCEADLDAERKGGPQPGAVRSGQPRRPSTTERPEEPIPPPVIRGPELSPLRETPRRPAGGNNNSYQLPKVELPSKPLPPGQIPEKFRGSASGDSGKPSASKRLEEGGFPSEPTQPSRGPAAKPGAVPKEPRKIEIPDPTKGSAASRSSSPIQLAEYREPISEAMRVEPREDSAAAARITLNRQFTAGWNADGRHGDEGISLLLEPRNAQGQPLPAAATVSVVLLDRALSGDAARVARWDLSPQELARLYRRTSQAEGFYLELRWPSAPPVHSHLHFFVRYTTRDGRKLEDNGEIDVALPGQAIGRWIAVPGGNRPTGSAVASSWQQGQASIGQGTASDRPGEDSSAEDKERSSSHVRTASAISDASASSAQPSRPRPVWSPNRH